MMHGKQMKIPALMLFTFVSAAAAIMVLAGSGTGCSGLFTNDTCGELAGRYDALLSGNHGNCLADTDCACFGGLTKKSPCGGLSDRVTAAKLDAIRSEYRDNRCSFFYRCAPMLCLPRCRGGRCVNANWKF